MDACFFRRMEIDIYRIIKSQDNLSMSIDFVDLQPCLIDFKLKIQMRQVFIQHKLDAKNRALNTLLKKVVIAQENGKECRYYFTAFDRCAKKHFISSLSMLTIF